MQKALRRRVQLLYMAAGYRAPGWFRKSGLSSTAVAPTRACSQGAALNLTVDAAHCVGVLHFALA